MARYKRNESSLGKSQRMKVSGTSVTITREGIGNPNAGHNEKPYFSDTKVMTIV